MKKSTLLMILSLVLAVALSAGSTLAYLQDTDEDVNVMTLGNVYIEQHEYERVTDENGNPVLGTEGEDFDADYGINKSYKLQEFTQGKPAYPAVYTNGTMAWDEFQQLWNQVGAPGSNDLFDDSMKNVIDKFVFVENTGASDAYYRTIVAIEVPEGISDGIIHTSFNANSRFDYNDDVEGAQNAADANKFFTTIDGTRYLVYTATYQEVLTPGEVSRPSLLQIYLDPKADNDEVALFGETWDVLVVSQAVQTAGFADAETALDTAFGEIDEDTHPWLGVAPNDAPTSLNIVEVGTNEELKAALTANEENIIVKLTADVTYDVVPREGDAMGGDKTETITIDGDGHTLTFNQTNSDWNDISTANGATLVLKNMNVTNSDHNDGPWNRHDLNFDCPVKLINVKSDKAVALQEDSTLENVTIADANTSDTYAIWVQPNGQKVTLNNVTIDMLDCSDGRGLKIDNQYAESEEQKVTLVVKNTTFKTEEKSAILVKSKVGADITLKNVDISAVAADTTNPVWVDEATASYADKVTVTGGSKIVEP